MGTSDDGKPEKLFVDDVEGLDESPIATAYAKPEGRRPDKGSLGTGSLSDKCDVTCLLPLIAREVSDGIIARIMIRKHWGNLRAEKKVPNIIKRLTRTYCGTK